MTTTDDRAWLTEGAQVAVYTIGRGTNPTARAVTVEKILKTYVVAGGAKYRLRDLSLIGHQDNWSSAPKLCPLDSPDVVAARKATRARAVVMDLINAVLDNKLNGSDPADLLAQATAIRDAATVVCTKLTGISEE